MYHSVGISAYSLKQSPFHHINIGSYFAKFIILIVLNVSIQQKIKNTNYEDLSVYYWIGLAIQVPVVPSVSLIQYQLKTIFTKINTPALNVCNSSCCSGEKILKSNFEFRVCPDKRP